MNRNISPQPAVSVIVPVYNADTFLTDCIGSILAQTYTDFELIIVDDGSTDNSPAIIAGHAARDSRIVVLRRQNGGLSAARNTGLDASRGHYIAFVDADDMLHPCFLATLMAMMRPGVDISACDSTSRQRGGQPQWRERRRYRTINLSGSDALTSMLYQTSRLRHNAWGKLYRRHLWENLRYPSGWFEDLHISADLFPQARNLAFTSAPLYFYRRHSGSYLSRADESRTDAIHAARHVLNVCAASSPGLSLAASDRLLSASFNLLVMLATHPCAIDPSVRAICRRNIIRHRRATILNPRSRLRNRAAVLLTYTGLLHFLSLASTLTRRLTPNSSKLTTK